jgi:ankyrin repeat protein
MTSILQGSESLMTMLLESNADPNLSAQASRGIARFVLPLETASRAGSPTMVRTLLSYGAHVDKVSHWAWNEVHGESTALLIACDNGSVEVFRTLLEAGADPGFKCKDSNIESGMRSVRDTLSWMMSTGDAANCSASKMFNLISAAESVSLPEGPFHLIATYVGPCMLARLRMTAPWCASSKFLHPWSCRHVWRSTPYVIDVIHLLSTTSPSLERLDALWMALQHHADTRPKEDWSQWDAKALDLAVGGGKFKPCASTCRLLLSFGADPNRRTGNHETLCKSGGNPLMTTILQRSDSLMQLLLENGADPNLSVQSSSGIARWSLPLETASRVKSPTMVKTLLNYGAYVDTISGWAWNEVHGECTALLTACDNCCVEVFRELLERGADPGLQCKDSTSMSGTRSVRDTLALMMNISNATSFSASLKCRYSPEKLMRMLDLLSASNGRRSQASCQNAGLMRACRATELEQLDERVMSSTTVVQ